MHAGSKGYSFATWMRLEDVDGQHGTAGRALFTLLHRTDDATKGVAAAVKGISMQPVPFGTEENLAAYLTYISHLSLTCYLQTVTRRDVCIHCFKEVVHSVIVVHAGSRIAVRALGANKTSEAQLEYKFQAKQWYHIVLTHSTGSALAPAWVRLFVNGTLEASERFKYPKVCMSSTISTDCMSCCSTKEPHSCIAHAGLSATRRSG